MASSETTMNEINVAHGRSRHSLDTNACVKEPVTGRTQLAVDTGTTVAQKTPPAAKRSATPQHDVVDRSTRQRFTLETCCDCSRFSTCQSIASGPRRQGCACRKAGRHCTNCDCKLKCLNRAVQNVELEGEMMAPKSKRCRMSFPAKTCAPNGQIVDVASESSAPSTPTSQTSTDDDEDSLPTAPSTPQNDGDSVETNGDRQATTTLTEINRAATSAPLPGGAATPPSADLTPADSDDITQPVTNRRNGETPPEEDSNLPQPPHITILTEDGADDAGYELSKADKLLNLVYGDHPHRNAGTHLNGDIAEDTLWQGRWKKLVQIHIPTYVVPSGKVGKRFVRTLAREFKGVRERQWNSERPLCFANAILQRVPTVTKYKDVRRRMIARMDLWDQGHHARLINDVVDEANRGGCGKGKRKLDDETLARSFNARVESGHLRQAVRYLTNRDGGGTLGPDDLCTKTQRRVFDVLQEKHPPMREPNLDARTSTGIFEHYDECPEAIDLDITQDTVEKVASRLHGSAGPSGTDAVALRDWLLRFGEDSKILREELAAIARWLANHHPPWAAYRALMACRLVALDKQPGVRPIGIGEVYRRLIAKCVIAMCGYQATSACGNFNLCAGLPAGIEGAVHAISKATESYTEESTLDDLPQDLTEALSSPIEEADDIQIMTQEVTVDMPQVDVSKIHATLLVDARNGFNELSRKTMLWTVRHLWSNGSRFAFNCYRHSAQLILRNPHGPCSIILSQEGVTQGDPISMILYGLALTPLAKMMRKENPSIVQPWYADDCAMSGPALDIATSMNQLQHLGPARGYFPEPAKSILICHPSHREALKMALADFDFKYEDGFRYVGGFIGTTLARDNWLAPQITKWTNAIRLLARVATHFPQAAYVGLTRSLQMEWQYLQRVVPGVADSFEPVEKALVDEFLPALLGENVLFAELREVLSLPIKSAGLGISNPMSTASECHRVSKACTQSLTDSLLDGEDLDVVVYGREVKQQQRQEAHGRRMDHSTALANLLDKMSPSKARRIERAKETGGWLSILPNSLNGTTLERDEFRDSLRIRYGLAPLNLPMHCDGCGDPFTVQHAMTCKKGGLVMRRHEAVAAEWHDLCARATTSTSVSDEPLIYTGQSRLLEAGVGGEILDELRGDVGVHGFWRRGQQTIFDVRVTNTECASQRRRDPRKVLASHEKLKKQKYLEPCLAQRKNFTPLVFSVDGLRGVETEAACKRLASLLSKKWKRDYSEVCGFVRSRLSLALVRSASFCLRGARGDPSPIHRSARWEEGAGMGLYH